MKNHDRRSFVQSVIIYFSVLLPLLFISFFVTYSSNRALWQNAEQSIDADLENISARLNELYGTFSEAGNLMLNHPALLKKNMLKNTFQAGEGIELLNFANQFNPSTTDVFMCYGDMNAYSGKGFSRLSTLFKDTLGCTQNSTNAALEMTRQEKNGLCPLWKVAENDGYLLIHFPRKSISDDVIVSANFVVPFDKLAVYLRPVEENQQTLLKLKFVGGDTLYCRRAGEKISFSSDSQDKSGYTIEKYNSLTGITVTLTDLGNGLYSIVEENLRTNCLVLTIAILISLGLSFYFSVYKSRRILQLEALSRGEGSHANVKRDEFERIEEAIRKNIAYQEELRQSEKKLRQGMRSQFAKALFNGLYQNEQVIMQQMSACDLALMEQYYCIIAAVLPWADAMSEKVQVYLGDKLNCTMLLCGEEALVYLQELPNGDAQQTLRTACAARFSHMLSEHGLHAERIAISRVYSDIQSASFAYRDVEFALMHGSRQQTILMRDGMEDVQDTLLRLPQDDLNRLSDALLQRDEEGSSAAFQIVKKKEITAVCSENNHALLRYSIVQALFSGIKECENASAELQIMIDSDFHDSNSFYSAAEQFIKRYCADVFSPSDFSHVLEYVKKNYQDSSLSAEMVAHYAGISTSYLSRLFRAKTGTTYIEYLTGLRMNRAALLLEKTDLTIREIVEQVGYIDVSGFRKKFKAFFGVSVSDYRKKTATEE